MRRQEENLLWVGGQLASADAERRRREAIESEEESTHYKPYFEVKKEEEENGHQLSLFKKQIRFPRRESEEEVPLFLISLSFFPHRLGIQLIPVLFFLSFPCGHGNVLRTHVERAYILDKMSEEVEVFIRFLS